MRTLPAAGLCFLLLPSGAGAKQANKPDVKLIASLDMAAPEQQPILVIHIVNQSGHVLRIPEPPLLCKGAPGALSLEVRFTPENSNQAQAGSECGLEVDGSGLPDIRERAKKWLTLKPGQNYEARRPLAMGVDTNAHGTYEFRVVYDGPSASPEDDEKLKEAGIAVPEGKFESDKLTYKINAPKP
ncbi:MAG TPA: hypothetical protein VMB49_05985 [Acidobacteriaceae bacterium]|nr:hypothetical protein [Acidobacteriaceae bacterium]